MKAKIFGAIIGLTLLLGSPLTLLSLIDSYSSPFIENAEIVTSLQTKSFVNVDFPMQDGNIRLQKIDFRDLRTTTNHVRNFLSNNCAFSTFDPRRKVNRILSFRNSVSTSLTATPLFIRLRTLLV